MLAYSLKTLTNRVRRRTSDPYALAACNALDQLALDIEAGRRRRACRHCRSMYRRELKQSADWAQRTGYYERRRKGKAVK
jgi:hypothetical protein